MIIFFSCTLTATTVKFNGDNYLLQSQSFRVFVEEQRKIGHHIDEPLNVKDTSYSDWAVNECCIIPWLLNNMEEKFSSGVIFFKAAEKICDTLKEVYSNQKNIYRVFE